MAHREKKSKGPLSLIILEEIGLEGLEGLSIDGLWIRLSEALRISLPLEDHFQNQVWEFLKTSSNYVEFYELPETREKLKTFDRFKVLNPESDFPIVPEECPETRYKLYPIQNNKIMGSCQFYNERKSILFCQIHNLQLHEVIKKYGDKFIIVGNQEFRESILYPNNIQRPHEITKQQYCILEIIGRSRYNGEKTAGKFSLQHYCKDSTDLFYIRNKLLSQNLIVKQPYTEMMSGRSVNAYLLTLPRFFIEYKTKQLAIVETIFNILQNKTEQRMEYDKLKLNLAHDYVIYLKKLQLSSIFKKLFEIYKAPYRTMFPEATKTQWKRKGFDEEKQIILIRIRNKNTTLEDIFNDDYLFSGSNNPASVGGSADSTETDKIEFVNGKHFYIDMPYLEQVYRLIEKHGSVGCSQPQLQRILVVERYTVRALIKQILKIGLVTHYWQDFGRQKTIMYVARKHSKNLNSTVSENKNDVEILKCEDMKVVSENVDENKQDINEDILANITAVVKDVSLINKGAGSMINLKQQTVRQVRRQKIIVSTVDEKTIIDKIAMRKKIMSIEKSEGYKDEICSKSLNRIINSLAAKNIIKVYEVTLEMRKCIKCYRYFVHPSLEPNHHLLQDEINKLKNHLHLNVEEREMREQVIAQKIYKKEILTSSKAQSDSGYSNFYRRAPKFLTSRFFHEFLYYLVYEINSDIQPITNHDNIVKMLIESAPQYDLNNLEKDLQTHYTDNLSWKMFIPPLQRSPNKPYGWAYIMDVFIRIPLSLLMKLYQIDRNSNELLNEYLNHPIKQHYLLQKLPPELQDFIFKLRMSKTSLNFFKILNLIGLVQLGKRNTKYPKETWFYLNRNAKLLDTSISEPGYRSISLDKNYQEYKYRFDTFQDVQNYWNFLYKTCCLTRLGVRIDVQQKNRQEPTELLPVKFDKAEENDIGYIPGDGRGAGGLDSLLFAHLKSNWSWSVKLAKKKISVKASAQRVKLGEINANKKIIKNLSAGVKRKISLVPLKKIKRRIKSINNSNSVTSATKSKRSQEYDDIDRDALKRMDSLRVQWNKDEDNLLKVCRAVFIYLNNSVSQLNRVINAHNYRDILHCALNSRNKTSKACQRRILFIFKKHQNTDISAWVHELKRNRHIKQRFGTHFIDNLRKICPDDCTFSESLKVHFVQLVYYLNKIIKNANLSIENECILPDTLMQFNRFYKECTNISPSYKDDDVKHFNPKSIEDIEISTINSLMHSTMCCNRDKTLYNIQLFEIYKNFKEEILSKAFKKAKDDCLVVGTKGTRNSVGSVTGPSFILSVKYRQALFLNIPYEILDKCYETLNIFLTKFFPSKKYNVIDESTIDFKTINSGVFYLITEMCAKNQILINIQMPQKILTIDPTQQQNVSDSERILDHFHQIFDNAPKQEYLKMFETENNNSDGKTKQHIKFNIANENYKLIYNPFNILSKLSDDYLHFFCALDHLNKIVDLDFTRFTTDNFCPFSNCVLKNTNFINVIERIIHEKKLIIEDLIRTNDTEEIVENIVILNQKNILQIYYRLQDTLRLRNRLINLKDYGKIKASCQVNYLDILKLCKDIIDYKEIDEKNQQMEYVPILNKEEKIIRAHDIFVVNLPTLKISLNKNEFMDNESKIFKNNLVPKTLIQSDTDRDAILKKILGYSIWSHFGSITKLNEDDVFLSYTSTMQAHIIDLLSFINAFPLGATTNDLVDRFKDEIFLVNATRILRKHFLIMRVGIHNFMYVHKNHISNWVVQTYHIKRLDKESLQNCQVTIISKEKSDIQKRKFSKIESESVDQDGAIKQMKTNEGKRVAKPIEKFTETNHTQKIKTFTPKEKETIIIRPCPWIRINGSLNRRVLDRWLGCIVIDCLSNCGQTIRKLCTNFNQMHPVNLMCLLEVLHDLNCIKLNVSKPQKQISLFTKYEYWKEDVATEFSEMDEVFITATPNAIINIALFIGDKQYLSEFI